jgi:ketosteroid isomerase-like protein
MSELQAILDRSGITALGGEYADALMSHDFDRVASLFTDDGAVRLPHAPAAASGREDIRTRVERLQRQWEYFVQATQPGIVALDGDTAVGLVYLEELMKGHDSTAHRNVGVYHDRYRRTPDGWKFSERVYEVLYEDRPLT